MRIGLTGAAYDDTPRMSSPEDLKFLPTVATMKAQAEALRREGADFVVAVVHADRTAGLRLVATRAVDLILTGHNHDLFINFDGRNAMVESSYDAHYVTVIDVTIDVKLRERAPRDDLVAAVPRDRHRDGDARSGGRGGRCRLRAASSAAQMDVPLGTTAVELDSRNATVRTREAAIGNLIADAMRAATHADVAIMNGGGIRGGKIYRAGRDDHPPRRARRTAVRQSPGDARDQRAATSGGDRERAVAAAQPRRPVSRRCPA